MYPVGACYFSTVSTSPSSAIGGTWIQMTGGMLGLTGSTGVAEAASDGGSRKISVSQMPEHSHSMSMHTTNNETTGYGLSITSSFANRVLVRTNSTGQLTRSTGGVRTIFPHTPLSMVGDVLLSLSGGE